MNKFPRVRMIVGVTVVLAMTSIWAFKTYHGEPVNPIFAAIVVIYALAAGYVVFGKRAFETAKETYDSLTDSDEDNGGDESSSE